MTTGSVFQGEYMKPAPHDQAARDALVLAAVSRGEWVQWPKVQINVPYKGHTIGLQVAVDYFAIGTLDDHVRVPMGAAAAQAVADRFGASLPTPRMADLIWRASTWQIEPIVAADIGVEIGAEQESGAACVLQSRLADSKIGGGAGLRSGFKKDVVISSRLADAPVPGERFTSYNRDGVCIYGFWRKTPLGDCSQLPASPGICVVQGVSTVHERSYADYSHGVRLVSQQAFVDGTPASLASILQHPELAWALSHEGPMRALRYRDPIPTIPGAGGGGWCQGFAGSCSGGGGMVPPAEGGASASTAIVVGGLLVIGAGVVWAVGEGIV